MAEYGIEIRDASGNVVLDNDTLALRLWYSGTFTNVAVVTFAEPLEHEPIIFKVEGFLTANPRWEGDMVVGIDVVIPEWYEGIDLGAIDENDLRTTVLVFARE